MYVPEQQELPEFLTWKVDVVGCSCCGSIFPCFKCYFPMFLGKLMYDNEFETMENKI